MPSQHASSLRGLACLTLAILTLLPLLSGGALAAQPASGARTDAPAAAPSSIVAVIRDSRAGSAG